MAGCKIDVTAIPTPGMGTPSGLKVNVTALPAGFQGLQGVAGADGKTWYSGTSTPSDGVGVDGDFYLNTATYDVYEKASGTWGSPLLNIKGATGETGAKGDKGDPGSEGTVQLNNYNSFTYVWKDNATITVKAGGQATTADGTVTHTLAVDTDLALPGGLDTGNEAANTKYYAWIGTIAGVVTLKFSLSATSPTGLTNPIRLPGCSRNDASSNILPFQWEGNFYHYLSTIALDGNDKTQIFNGTTPTSGTPGSLDLSAFAPPDIRGRVVVGLRPYYTAYGAQWIYIKPSGGSNFQRFPSGCEGGTYSYLAGVLCVPYAFTWYADVAYTGVKFVLEGFWGK